MRIAAKMKPFLDNLNRDPQRRTRRRRSRLVLLGLIAMISLPASQSHAGAAAPAGTNRLHVMTWNLHHAEGVDGRVDLERIAGVIREQKPDLVALQEVDKGVARTDRIDTPAELARLTGMTALFHNNFPYQGGEYGNAILSRFPVLSQTNTLLKMLRSGEQRGVLQAVVQPPGKRSLLFASTHIDYRRDDAERLANVAEFKALPDRYPGLPFLICGDFNDFPGSRVHTEMKEDFVDCWEPVGKGDGFTFASDRPRSRIDYIWVGRGENTLRPLRAWIPRTEASDHLPLLIEFELP